LEENESFKRGREIFVKVGMMKSLGASLDEVTEDSATASFIPGENAGNYMGGLHGGAVAALIDTVAFFPGCCLPSGRKLTTESANLHFFAAARLGEKITAVAKVLRNGKRVIKVEVSAFRADGKKIVHSIVTMLDI